MKLTAKRKIQHMVYVLLDLLEAALSQPVWWIISLKTKCKEESNDA